MQERSVQGEAQTYGDVNATHWAYAYIEQVTRGGLMEGYPDGSFRPDQALTRAEGVRLMNQLLNRGPLKGVTESSWPDVPMTH